MSTTTTKDLILSVKTPLGPDAFRLTGFTGREAISELFELRLELFADAGRSVAFDQLLGHPVTVTVRQPDGAPRYLNGIASAVTQGGTTKSAASVTVTTYRMTVVPTLWLLTRRRQSRIFQQLSVPDILKKVLAGIDASYNLQGTYQPRDYCVQYRETDFEFASRLMEEEGIYYFFKHADGAHTLVVGDTPVSHAEVIGSTLKYLPVEGGVSATDRVTSWEKSQRITSGNFTLWDHSFEIPHRHLDAATTVKPESVTVGTTTHKLRVADNGKLEQYDFPGGYAKRFDGIAPGGSDRASDVQHIFEDNLRTVNIRMAQEATSALVIRGESSYRNLVAGHKFALEDSPDGDGSYVLVSVEHEARLGTTNNAGGTDTFTYTNRFTAVPAALPYRPPRVTPHPFVHGCQTAVVVGPSGEEIFTDKYGRVKVQFHWDREGKNDASSSCWVRVASHWAGRKWGAVHLPRIGQEVVVDFEEGDPDQPIIVGSVYNADMMPPYDLPANKTQSGIKSRSTLKGTDDNFNEIRFEDKKGEEEIYVQAERNLTTHVENDEKRYVYHDRTTTVSNNDTRIVGGKDKFKDGSDVGGNDVVTVMKGNRTITVKEGNLVTTVSQGNETREITQGDQTIDVKQGKQTITIMSDQSLTVKTGNRTTSIDTGNDTHKVKTGNISTEASMGNISTEAKLGNISIKADLGKITIEALQGIELKVGPSSIKLDMSGITMSGLMIKVDGSAMTQVSAGAMLTLKGGITMIN